MGTLAVLSLVVDGRQFDDDHQGIDEKASGQLKPIASKPNLGAALLRRLCPRALSEPTVIGAVMLSTSVNELAGRRLNVGDQLWPPYFRKE